MHSYIFHQLFKDTENCTCKKLKNSLQYPYCKHIQKFSLILYQRHTQFLTAFLLYLFVLFQLHRKKYLKFTCAIYTSPLFQFLSSYSAWEQIRLLLPLWLGQNHRKAKFPYFSWPIAYTDINTNCKTIFPSHSCCQ